jgi:hypothetical protein
MEIPRYHTSKKEILRFPDLDLKELGMEKDFKDFFKYLDEIERSDLAELTIGQWKKLFAALRKIGDKLNINYCIYQNKFDICFDTTSNCIGKEENMTEDERGLSINTAVVKESPIDKLKRYTYELTQKKIKIARLQEEVKELEEKIKPLKEEVAAVLDSLNKVL